MQMNASVMHELFCWYKRTAISLMVIVNLRLLKNEIVVLLQWWCWLAGPSSDLIILNVLVPRRSSHNISVDVVEFTGRIGPSLARLLSIIELSNPCAGHYIEMIDWTCTTYHHGVLSATQLTSALRCSLSSACTYTNTWLVWSIYCQRQSLNRGWAELSPCKSLRHIVSQTTRSRVSH